MKKALVILDSRLQVEGLVPGTDYEFCANVHDEWQIDSTVDAAPVIGLAGTVAIKEAGEFFKFKCPLAGEYKVGHTWKETH